MAGLLDEPFGVHAPVPEGGLGFRGATRVGFGDAVRRRHDAHPAPAATGDRLEQDGRAGPELSLERLGAGGIHRALGPRDDGDVAFHRELASTRFVTEARERLRRGADERDPRGGARRSEGRALAREAVARVDRLAALAARDLDQLDPVEIRRGADPLQSNCGVGHPGVETRGVVFRVHGDRAQPGLLGGPGDAHGDLPPVGDQQLLPTHAAPAARAGRAPIDRGVSHGLRGAARALGPDRSPRGR